MKIRTESPAVAGATLARAEPRQRRATAPRQPASTAGLQPEPGETTSPLAGAIESSSRLATQRQLADHIDASARMTAQRRIAQRIAGARPAARPLQLQPKAGAGAVIQRVGGETTGYDAKTISDPEFGKKVSDLFSMARTLNKIRKTLVTRENSQALATLPEKQRGTQVKGSYALGLTGISLDATWLNTVLTNPAEIEALVKKVDVDATLSTVDPGAIRSSLAILREHLGLDDTSGKKKLVDSKWDAASGKARAEAEILSGEDAFELIPVDQLGGDLLREVYRKRGKADGEKNQYVKDDFGTLTHRFAYMEKGYHQWIDFQSRKEQAEREGDPEKPVMAGKHQELVSAATGEEIGNIDPTNYADYADSLRGDEQHIATTFAPGSLTGGGSADDRKKAVAYMHQWKGSGPGQRGLSLTATDKEDAVFGNAGESFKTADGAKFKVDLAKVDPASNSLINHYAASSPMRSPGLVGEVATWNRGLSKLGSTKLDYQYERSVIKNREIYLRHLTPNAVTSIALHQSGTDIVAAAKGFREQQAAAIVEGKKQYAALMTQRAGFCDELVDVRKNCDDARQRLQQQQAALTTALASKKSNSGIYRKYKFVGFANTMSYYQYYDEMAKRHRTAIDNAKGDIRHCEQLVHDIKSDIADCDRQIDNLGSMLASPLPIRDHELKGWESGKSYIKGYIDGRDAARNVANTEKARIKKIFDKAYDNITEVFRNNGTLEKYLPYWQGYGAALREP